MNIYHLDDIPEDLRSFFEDVPQLGLEKTPEEFVAKLVAIFREVKRVLRDDGILFLNLGDSYARNGGTPGGGNRKMMHMEGTQRRMGAIPEGSGLKEKDLVGIPWMTAFALRRDGWYLRQEIIWHKPQPMPESVTDRCTKAHEQIFLLAKSSRYYFDAAAIATPCSEAYANDSRWETGPTPENEKNGYALAMAQNPKAVHRVFNGEKPKTVNRRSVWTIPTAPLGLEHFASYPPDLARLCIMAGCPVGGTVLDCFFGSGTTGMVCTELRRKSIGIELNPEYCAIAQQRTHVTPGLAL